ncbi:hypothetical protein [Botryobacter ruber]|uniref:hypothetical protein n=1 Tax=Botryobacter ruber TaxID=2171629 RepID=UPI000E0B8AAD|nr:hypothetical protein [Botryobacter ruber]
MHPTTDKTEIYATPAGTVYQCDRRNRLLLSFSGSVTVLKLDTFLRLQKAVDAIDLEEMAASTNRASDLEIISVFGCDRCFVLTLPELYALNDLLAGAKFALELNRMLHECLSCTLA